MQYATIARRSFFCFLILLFSWNVSALPGIPPAREYYEIRVYHLKEAGQQQQIDQYLKEALLPGLHRAGISKVGVFKPIGIDTASKPVMYVLIPYASFAAMEQVSAKLDKDKQYLSAGAQYLDAAYDSAPYERMEKILLKAFPGMPMMKTPSLKGPRSENVYELRSYEGPTEKLYVNKVKMFNTGDEIGLFDRLGFNGVFYAEVLAGCHMPNLMYMTSFDSKAARDEHWKAFGSDAQWKKLSSMPEYQHNVSHSDINLLHATDYSDF